MKVNGFDRPTLTLNQDFQLISPSRSYVREGMLGKVNNHGKLQERYCFLFNDVLVYTAPQLLRKNYQFKGYILLDKVILSDANDTSNCDVRTSSNLFQNIQTLSRCQYWIRRRSLYSISQRQKKKHLGCQIFPSKWIQFSKSYKELSNGKQKHSLFAITPLLGQESFQYKNN